MTLTEAFAAFLPQLVATLEGDNAQERAQAMIDNLIAKTVSKLGDRGDWEVRRVYMDGALSLTMNLPSGDQIWLDQRMILNRRGHKLFSQWPAHLYLNGKIIGIDELASKIKLKEPMVRPLDKMTVMLIQGCANIALGKPPGWTWAARHKAVAYRLLKSESPYVLSSKGSEWAKREVCDPLGSGSTP